MAERKVTKTVAAPAVSSSIRGVALAAMIVGIVGVVFCWIPFWGFVISGTGLGLGIAALVKRAPNHGMALAGTILGGVGILLNLLVIVLFVFFFAIGGSPTLYHAAQPDYYNY